LEKTDYKIALMIDAENIPIKYVKAVMKEMAKYGRIVIARFYGDVYKASKEWHQTALDFAIKPMHQYQVANAKNAADMALALDALEMMYQEKVNAFFLVSSDSDFTPLAMKLKEGGMHVVGIGNEKKVTNAFKSACNEFKYFEYLDDEDEEDDEIENIQAKNGNKEKIQIEQVIKDLVIENGVSNRIQLSRLGDILVNRFSDFDARKYGAKSLSSLVSTIKGLELTTEKTTTYVSLKPEVDLEEIKEKVYALINKNKTKQMILTKLKQELEKTYPKFEYKTYGYTKFSKFISSFSQLTVHDNLVKLTEPDK